MPASCPVLFMSGGRGRGRGRGGIPINYPDGLAAKQPSRSPFPDLKPPLGLEKKLADGLPLPPVLSAEDKEALAIRRQMQNSPNFAVFRVGPTLPHSDFERYSDRYRNVPKVPFAKSPAFCLREGVHYFSELKPTIAKHKSSKGKRRGRGGYLSVDTRSIEEEMGLEALVGGEGEEGEEGEDAEKQEDTPAREGEGEGGEEDEEDEDEDEEDDLLSEGDAGFDDFETGGDDADSGGDDEPTY